VIPFAAGGVADITARIVADKLGSKLGQRFYIENLPGAGGIAAARAVISARADGYTLALLTNGTAISVSLFEKLPFDPLRDFAPVSSLGFFDFILATGADSPYKTLGDFIAAARAAPRTFRPNCSRPQPASISRSCPTGARPKSRCRCCKAISP
jgi:tripartite-type tricarboxylate transporter receptor subunit TctC